MINLDRIESYDIVSADTETTGLHWYRDKMFGIAICGYADGKFHSDYWDIREKPHIIKPINAALKKAKKLVNHNIKFDYHMCREAGILLPIDVIECTTVRAALINEHEPSFSMDKLCRKYIGRGKVDIYEELAALFGGKPTREAQMKNLFRAPLSVAKKYAIEDPELAIRLWLWQEEEIKVQELEKVWGLEKEVTKVLIDMEKQGVRVDEKQAERSIGDVDKLINEAQRKLNHLAGGEVNASSPLQMRKLFGAKVKHNEEGDEIWTTDKGFVLSVTETGNPSIDKDALKTMAGMGDQRAEAILTLRRMTKAKSFLKDHIIGHAVNGYVYPNYNQTKGDNELGTGTGRFSIDDPALQQIPSRDKDVAAIVRSKFLPEDGDEWYCSDWEQFEFRWFAHYTKDPKILKAYADDPATDYHSIVADITGIPRNPRSAGEANAKQINLGLVFGMGQGELAYQMGMEHKVVKDESGRIWKRAGPQAMTIFNTYHGAIPGVKTLLDQASSIAKSRGYVETKMGRHIRFPGGKFTHKAAGLVFQGTSADCMKQKMVELHPIAKSMGFKMLLSVHDELDFSIPKKMKKEAAEEITNALQTFDGIKCPIECRVPILSSGAFGPNWYEASKK